MCPIMRTALAASVAAVAKWTFVAASLGLQAVPKRRSVWSRAAGTSFARPVPQPESRHIDLPEREQVYVESLLIMRTALAVRVAAVAKWISGAVSLRLQAVPERRQAYIESFLNIYKLLMRTALAASVAAVAKWISGAVSLGVQVVPKRQFVWSMAAGADAKRNGFVCPIMRTALAASVALAAKWISGAAPLGVQAVPKRRSVWSMAAGADAKRNGFVCPIMRTALAASVAAAAKWIFVAAPLGLQAVPERQFVSSRAAGTRFARPVPQPESRHIDLPEQEQVYVESLLIMRTALAVRVAAVAKWIFVAAPLGLQAVPERRQAYIESFLNIYKLLMRTALAASVAAVAKWIFVAAPLGVQAVPERQSV